MKTEEQLKQTMREERLSDEAKERILKAALEQAHVTNAENSGAETKELSIWEKIAAKQKTIIRVSVAIAAVFVSVVLIGILSQSKLSRSYDKSAKSAATMAEQRQEVTKAAMPPCEIEQSSEKKENMQGIKGQNSTSFPESLSDSQEESDGQELANTTILFGDGKMRFLCENLSLCQEYYPYIVTRLHISDEVVYITEVVREGDGVLVTAWSEPMDSDHGYQSFGNMDTKTMKKYTLLLDEKGRVIE